MGAVGSSPNRTFRSPLSASRTCYLRIGVPSSDFRRSFHHRHRFFKLLEKSFSSKKSFNSSSNNKNAEYTARVFRDLISCWPLEDLEALYAEFQSAHVVRNLFLRSVSTRPKVPSLKDQMAKAFEGAVQHDFVIVFKGESFKVHKCVLIARSGYFADLLSSSSSSEGPSCSLRNSSSFELELPGSLDVYPDILKEFLRFLYCGKTKKSAQIDPLLAYFSCGRDSYFEDFLKFSAKALISGDCELRFSSSSEPVSSTRNSPDYVTCSDSTFLSIRSSYFRSLFVRRRKQDDAEGSSVTLSENVIPRAYVPVILRALYTDDLDFSYILTSTPESTNSLCEVQAMVSGKDPNSPINRATELYHIAVFLSFYRLAQQCEDVIVRNLNLDSLIPVYNWASEAGGSNYIRRHCLNMIYADFAKIANSHSLFDMSEDLLYECVSSDFVQASEIDLLNSVIRWGEHEFLRRIDQLEASTSAGSSPGTSLRRTARRRAAHPCSNDIELKALVGELLSLIRTPFIIPPFHQSLNEVYKRGLLTRHPYRHGSTTLSGFESNPDGHWFNFAQMSSSCSESEAFLLGPRFLRVYHNELVEIIKMRYHAVGSEWKPAIPADNLFSPSDVILINDEPHILEHEEWTQVQKRFYQILNECKGMRFLCVCNCAHHMQSAVNQIRTITALELNVDESLLRVEMRPHSTRSLGTGRRRDLGCRLKHHLVTGASSDNLFVGKHSDEIETGSAAVQPDLVVRYAESRKGRNKHPERL
ncbi:hypothetical protein L596_028057 [Steinernema carpocapsae]|uniref:BTB domain-containing protein n=1 Tax=Steinernema carpocapsae TaxID=34508 RepID=A0A4V5ZXS3_STECR|nr:hypothetical protein L596_028057 [Steinernema carpocapsae]